MARRTSIPATDRSTTYVNLWNKPAKEVESLLLGTQIVAARGKHKLLSNGDWHTLMVGEKAVGVAFQVPQKHLGYNWLHPCTFARPALSQFAFVDASPKKGWIQFQKAYTSTGADIKQVKDHFAEQDAKTSWRMV